MKSIQRSWPVVAVLVTLGVHLIIAAFHPMPGSFRKYTLAAEQHLAGDLPSERLMDLSPFYFELAVAVTRITGPGGSPSDSPNDRVLTWLQILLVALTAGFLAELYQRRFGRALSIAGIVIFLLDRQLVVYERILEPEAWLLFFLFGWICLVERLAHGVGGWRLALVAGLLAGAGLMTRPTFLPMLILVPLYLYYSRPAGRPWLGQSLAFGLPVVAVMVLLALRASAVTGDPRTPVMNPGTVMYEGNQSLSGGTSAIYPAVVRGMLKVAETRPDAAHEHYRAVARAATGEDLSISEVNAYWSALTLGYIRAEPARFFGLLRDKLVRGFHAYRWHDVPTAWHYDRTLHLPSMPFALLSGLALIGMLFEARRFGQAFLFYGLTGLQVAVMLVFYVSSRQRLVLLPVLIYFALVAIERLWQIRRDKRSAGVLVVLVLLLALCFALPNDLISDDRHVKEGSAGAEALFAQLQDVTREQPMAAHIDLALEALGQAPWVMFTPAFFPQEEQPLEAALAKYLEDREALGSVSQRFDLGVAFLRALRLDDAERVFEALVAEERVVYRGARQASLPRYHLARVWARRGNRAKAVELLKEALERSPGNAFVLAELLALTDDPDYRLALEVGSSVIDTGFFLGRALLFHGRAEDAVRALRPVAERLPSFRTGRIYLAAALSEAGRVDEAAALYLETVKREPDPLILSAWITDMFRRWLARHPDDPQVRLFSARVLHEYGYFREALKVLEATDPPPALKAAHQQEIQRIEWTLRYLGPS